MRGVCGSWWDWWRGVSWVNQEWVSEIRGEVGLVSGVEGEGLMGLGLAEVRG